MRTADEKLLNAVQRPDAYEEVVVSSGADQVVLSVWRGPQGAPAVLFLPGTMTHPLFYEDFLDALNRAGCTVVGLHSASHGKSPRIARRLTFADLVQNGLDALGWMRTTFPASPLVVLGSSQGGVLAMALAARTTDLAAVFAHNVLDATLPSTLTVTRLPAALSGAYRPLVQGLRLAAKVVPALPVPFDAYLDMRRVARRPGTAQRFYSDPLGLRTYPLALLAELLDEDVGRPVSCPVVVVAGSQDPLFSLDYTREVFDRISAPDKELLVVDSPDHLLFVDDIEAVLPALTARLRRLSPVSSGSRAS